MRKWFKDLLVYMAGRQPTHDEEWSGRIISETVQDHDESRPTQCECGKQATHWVEYLWRKMERNEFVSGHTIEDVCAKHFRKLTDNNNVQIQEWGEL